MTTIDLNCDLGESFGRYELGEQDEILKYVTSANIACGFHAGDPSVMRKTVEKAVQHGVKIGAHPSFPDLVGFGRREMAVSPQEAYDMVVYQIGALQGFAQLHGESIHHVKPHGAMYNMAAKNKELAQAIAQAVYDSSPTLILYGLANSELTRAGDALGLTVAHEVFADRTYQPDGTLTSRTLPNAMITDEQVALQQIEQMVLHGSVTAVDETVVYLEAHTICVHGDTVQAVQFVKKIAQHLNDKEVKIEPVGSS